jgi:hypothetical protein
MVLAALAATACGGPEVGSIADMSGYEELDDKDTQAFIVSDARDFVERLDRKETFAAYFGFVKCPWCEDAISILNREALSAYTSVFYINTRPSPFVKANDQIPGYDLLKERIGEHFGTNEDGEPYLYVPFVFFVRDGEIVLKHQGSYEGYDPNVMDMPDELAEKLEEIYRQGFELIAQ